MAKTLRTSDDYTIKTGTGSSGSNTVFFDSKTTRVLGDFVVDGTRTELNTATLAIEDPILVLSKNNSVTDIDAGIMVHRGDIGNNAAIYWNEGDDVWRAVTTVSTPADSAIVDTALAKIQIAEPTASSDAATKNYVDTTASGAVLTGSTDNQVTTVTGANAITGEANLTFDSSTLAVTGDVTTTGNITVQGEINTDTIVSNSNGDITIKPAGTGEVVINDILTWSAAASDPTADSVTKIYNKAVGGGGSGVFFINSAVNSGTAGELISKSKATALAIALG